METYTGDFALGHADSQVEDESAAVGGGQGGGHHQEEGEEGEHGGDMWEGRGGGFIQDYRWTLEGGDTCRPAQGDRVTGRLIGRVNRV